jgi:hypothetical protein
MFALSVRQCTNNRPAQITGSSLRGKLEWTAARKTKHGYRPHKLGRIYNRGSMRITCTHTLFD